MSQKQFSALLVNFRATPIFRFFFGGFGKNAHKEKEIFAGRETKDIPKNMEMKDSEGKNNLQIFCGDGVHGSTHECVYASGRGSLGLFSSVLFLDQRCPPRLLFFYYSDFRGSGREGL